MRRVCGIKVVRLTLGGLLFCPDLGSVLPAGERVLASLTRVLGRRLKLKVNDAKSAAQRPWNRSFLGYSMTVHRTACLEVGAIAKAVQGQPEGLVPAGTRVFPCQGHRGSHPGSTRLDPIRPAGGDQRHPRRPRWLVSAQAASHPVAAMETPENPQAETDATRDRRTACLEVGGQRPWSLVERGRQPYESGLSDILSPKTRADAYQRTAGSPSTGFMNRPIRNCTYGGGGGRWEKSRLLPDLATIWLPV